MLNSLKSKFIISFIAIEILFFTLIITINFNSLDKASKTLTEEKIHASSELLVELIKTPLAIFDLATIDDALQSFLKIKNVVAVQVNDNENVTVSEYIKHNTIPKNIFDKYKNKTVKYNDRRYTIHTVEIISNNEKLGDIHFAFDTTHNIETIQANKNLTYFLVALALFVGFIISYFIGDNLGKSLKQLTDIAQSIAKNKKVPIPYDENRKDEMGQLFIAMSTMQEQISQFTTNLENSLNDLQQFMNAIDHSAIVSRTDENGVINYVNSLFCKTSGYSKKELVGKTHRLIKHPDMGQDFYKELWRTILSKKVFKSTFKNLNKNSQEYYVDATIVPLLNSKGDISQFIAISYEVTNLVNAKNKALSAEKAKGAFLSNMSHEIRTPMNAILGFVQVLQKRVKDEKDLSYLNLIESSSKTLLYIINEILDYSKIESGKLVIDKHPFNPIYEFNQTCKIFILNAKEKSIKYLAYIDPNLPLCLDGNLTRIKQIIFNFLSNAFKFTPKNKKICIDITYDNQKSILHIKVKDEGIGISKEAQKIIFHPFEQADGSTTRKYGGTGLGLSISSKLASLMHGGIKLKSQPNKGTVFHLHIPLQSCPLKEHTQKLGENINNYSIGVLKADKNKQEILDLTKRYLKELNITKLKDISTLEEFKEDILIFIADDSIDIDKIIKLKKPSIALMAYESDIFTNEEQIVPLLAPYGSYELIETLNIICQHTTKEQNGKNINKTPKYKGKILVAEDNKTNQILIKVLLDEYGVEYLVADDGLKAVEAFKNSKYNLILMDENMPNMTGIQALQKIREYERENRLYVTPVVALTANVMPEDKKDFYEAGMDDFIGKPIDTNELERVLKRFLI